MTILDAALRHADLREHGGKNKDPWIAKANAYVRNPATSPYCAAGIAQSQLEAFQAEGGTQSQLNLLIGQGKALPITGSSQYLRLWAKQKNRLTFDPQKLLSFRGALFGWTNAGDEGHGHIGLVERRLTTNGKVLAIGTFEFNTDLAGDRDGEGAFRLERKVPTDRGRDLWYIDLTGLWGGDWWK
jgi:hypothetical protein